VSAQHEVKLIGRESCGSEIASFRFTKPDGYTFWAGQHMVLTLITAEGPQSKPFTHSQAPSDPYLELTTRLSGSAFKNALFALTPKDAVTVRGPGGRLVLPAGTTRIAFLVGGVGITPVRSILRDAVHRGLKWEEFEAMAGSGVRLINVLERAEPSWTGETGFVSSEIVRRHCDLSDGRRVLVSGPPVMVDAMERVLDELGVEGSRRMVERFSAPSRPAGA
jgi:ferredoxin-NADP reductase